MVMSQDQIAGRSHNMKVKNRTFGRVEEFKYLGTTLTYQNSIQKEIKGGLKSGNACYHSVQNLFSSRKIKIYRTIILPIDLYGCETWSLTLRKRRRLRLLRTGC
jgi:UDP-galactopyranose mutase